MAESWARKWDNFRRRDWEHIRESWISNTPPRFAEIGSPPDPGLENLFLLHSMQPPDDHNRLQDIAGVRSNALWEAVFLFHKCAHTNLAAQRVGQSGMHSWSMFNAYHSAYLGARGLMALLGVALPRINTIQTAIDLFPESTTPRKSPMIRKSEREKRVPILPLPKFEEFTITRLGHLDQRFIWQAFRRVLVVTRSKCWDLGVRQSLLNLPFEEITPPRNSFLYRAQFWPLPDLIADASPTDFDTLFGTYLDVGEEGFLLRLCFSVYYLFDQLMRDLAEHSGVIKQQFDASRIIASSNLAVLGSYANFVAQVSAKTI